MGSSRTEVDPAREVVINARNRERITFRKDECSAEVLVFDLSLDPGGGSERHFHDLQSETFHCVAGELTLRFADTMRVLKAGDVYEVPAGTVHSLVNEGEVENRCRIEFRPAGRLEEFIKVSSAVERKRGRAPGLLDLAPFLLAAGVFVGGPPRWLQRGLFRVLRPLAIALGRERAGLDAAREYYEPIDDR